jgi:hypothetical protein
MSCIGPTNDEIARVAYSFFETEGKVDGRDLEHWLCAEEQLAKAIRPRKNLKEVRGLESR